MNRSTAGRLGPDTFPTGPRSFRLNLFAAGLFVLLAPSALLSDYGSLPDPLLLENGDRVTSVDSWTSRRRPELEELFQREIYGFFPPVPEVSYRIVREEPILVRATYREIEISFDGLGERHMTVALFLPDTDGGPVPLVIGIGLCGNHTVLDYEGISRPGEEVWLGPCRFFAGDRGSLTDYWSVEAILDRGYAFATFHDAELDSDRDDPTDGIHGALREASIDAAGGDEEAVWGTVAAWAWGVMRVIDYAETDRIDLDRVAVVGHSRRAKAALLAGAFDERIRLTVAHQGGTGGEALSRGALFQEPVFLMNWLYSHWFAPRFSYYNFRIRKLPIDQHELIALVAPRTLLINAARGYRWAGFTSSLRAMHAAAPVYELFGIDPIREDGLVTDDELFSPRTVGAMTQYRRRSGHSLDPEYWRVILDVAAIVFDR